MIRGLVFDTDAPFLPEGAAPSPLSAAERLAGLTLLRRAVLMAWKAGAEEVTVVAQDPESARRWAASEVGLRVPVTVIAAEGGLPGFGEEDEVLVLSAQVLSQRGVPESLLERARQEGRGVVAVTDAASALGPAVLSARELHRSLGEGAGLAEAVRARMRSEGCAPIRVDAAIYRRLDSQEALEEAEREIYRGLTSITDGYLARVFYRRLSAWFTRRIIDRPITPNHVTWLHFSLGLAAAGLLWQGRYWQDVAGAVLLQLSVVLDCSDGEVARLKYQHSKFGSWFDVWTDNLVNIAVFAAIAHAAATRLGASLSLTLGALAVVGVLMCILVVFALAKLLSRRQPGQASALAVTNRLSSSDQASSGKKGTVVDAVINEATSRDFLVLVVLFALAGRLEWFVWLAAIGSHVFWVTFAVLQFSMLQRPDASRR